MATLLRFGVFEVDLQSRELRKRGMRLHLPEQSFEILAMLVERPGHVITREEIRGRLWPRGTVVEFEHSVNSAVRRLRDCLGDSATTPRFVETLPRRGYRFVAPVEAGHAAPPAPHFRILGELGRGGMGVVYKAEDLVLGRTVALKFLAERLASHPPSVERFRREARTLAALNHPGICALHGVEEHEGRLCLVMESVEGRPLGRLMEAGPLPVKQAVEIAADASQALAAAHAVGIVHHDVTPANVFVTGDGQVKILDFGLAEIVRRETARDGIPARESAETISGSDPSDSTAAVGSTDYMSPEQVRGESGDARTDVYSLGVVLFEMLCGKHPFRGESAKRTLSAILEDQPPPPRTLRPDLSDRTERVVLRCLEKRPEDRYSSAAELHNDLMTCLAPAGRPAWRRPAAMAAAALLVGAVGFFGVRSAVQAVRYRWVTKEVLPAVERLIQGERPFAALELIRTADHLGAAPPGLIQLRDRLPGVRVSLRTTPPGADISIVDYKNEDGGDASRWKHIGRSPLDTTRMPAGAYRVRATKDGFEPVERLLVVSDEGGRSIELELHVTGTVPAGMVWIPGTGPAGLGRTMFPAMAVEVPGFWIDKHEVTNRQFKQFVDAGGYRERKHWKHPFVKDGKELSWEETMAEFRDPSGKAGPATWELGSYPQGKDEYPVGGVSWYEAAAYAEFAGKSLPTVHHWLRAAGVGMGAFFQVLELSNLEGSGPAAVEAFRGLGPFGTYDMAGNVREWCWTPVQKFRYVLGGGWSDPAYQLNFPGAQSPIARGASNGFRCARFVSPPDEALTGEVPFVSRDRRGDRPASDEEYRILRSLHSYDRTDLKAAVESADEASPYWRREKVSFQAAYGGERVVAHLFLPRTARPPYQVVVHFPGSTALVAHSVGAPGVVPLYAERIVRSGRALILPAYKGMLERGPGTYYHWLGQPNRWRDMNLQWSSDLRRSIDYLESRTDIDSRNLAFLGGSLGGAVGPFLIAVEPRFKVAVLVSGGSFERVPPEVDAWNFAPRVRIPVLMQNGRDDFLFPVEASQHPLLRALGTPEKDKKHVLYDGAHNIYGRLDLSKDMLDWLDRYLGLVDLRR